MSVTSAASARARFSSFAIATIGILVAVAMSFVLAHLSPVKATLVLIGLAMFLPTLVLKNPKAYWLFLLVISIPFDISKWLSAWLIDPQTLVDLYGQPASGTTAIEVYLSDVVLVAMVLPWLAQVAMRREKIYFPAIGYFFVFYLVWALLVSLINAPSLYLSMFEIFRQTLYFLAFVYLINNLSTRLQLRSVMWAVFIGFIIGAASVIAFFFLNYGTKTQFFASLKGQESTRTASSRLARNEPPDSGNLTIKADNNSRGLSSGGEVTGIKRSQGIFRHPAIPASLCGLILPLVLAYLVAARSNLHRLLFFAIFALGIVGLALTFSRAGAIGLAAGIVTFFGVAGWSGLIHRRMLMLSVVALIVVATVSLPLLLYYFGTRPETFTMRFYLFEAALDGYAQHPILGVGLNNSTGAMKAGRKELIDTGIQMPPTESADSLYLVTLTEVGPLGFIAFFLFFGAAVIIALRAMRQAPPEMKPLLVGIVAGFGSLATQNLADDTLGGHAVTATLWLFVALIVASVRDIQAKSRPSLANRPGASITP